MGLDMYAYATNDRPTCPVDFETDNHVRLHYWRKHPGLHGWMEELYREKGGQADTFNCVSVELTTDDLDHLEADIKAGALPETCGFFFGESDGSEAEDDLQFITKARETLATGASVYYSSWW